MNFHLNEIQAKTMVKKEIKLKVEKANYIPVYVTPYYSGPRSFGAAPEAVNVHGGFDSKLKSTNKKDILEVRDSILKDNSRITPMVFFVLSARLYDVGERKESVFWFYAAKDRYRQVDTLGDPQAVGGAISASSSFSELMGPFINGFAFCDIDFQIKTLKEAAQWSKKNPYTILLQPQIHIPGINAKKVMDQVLEDIFKQSLEAEKYFNDPKVRADFKAKRKENQVDEKYCF